MIVVSDTGPIRYLVEIGAIDLLPELFYKVLDNLATYNSKEMTEIRPEHQLAGLPLEWLRQSIEASPKRVVLRQPQLRMIEKVVLPTLEDQAGIRHQLQAVIHSVSAVSRR